VDVVRLQRVVRETELVASARARREEAALDHRARSVPPQIRETCVQSQGDVDGVARRERLARPMRHARSRCTALASCTGATTSPRGEREIVLAHSNSSATHEWNPLSLSRLTLPTRVAKKVAETLGTSELETT
jgi:hypothetical protein